MERSPHEPGQFLILIADDDPALASLLREILADEGYDTLCCFSGASALRLIESDAPHLAILDLQMEHESAGLRVVEQIRHGPASQRLPVILCSAATPRLAALGPTLAGLGCVSMPKPFNLDHLLDTVRSLLLHPHATLLARERGR